MVEGWAAACVRGDRDRPSGWVGLHVGEALWQKPADPCWRMLAPPHTMQEGVEATWVVAYILDLIVLKIVPFWGGISPDSGCP